MASNDHDHLAAVPVLLRAFERSLDQTLAAYGDLLGALPRARLEAKISAVVGQSVFHKLGEAGAHLVDARGELVATHRLLEKVAKSIGVEVAAGDERPKPKDPFTSAEVMAPVEFASSVA